MYRRNKINVLNTRLTSYFATFFLLLSSLFSATAGSSDFPEKVEHVVIRDGFYHEFFSSVLRLALDLTTEEYGPYKISVVHAPEQKERLREQVRNNEGLTLLWSSTSEKREQQLLPVRFNLLKGVNGYRFIVTQKGRAREFEGVNSIESLRRFIAGSGLHWRDTEVLYENNLPVVTAMSKAHLYSMLKVGRFDYMSRGAYEIWDEMSFLKEEYDLVPDVMLHYSIEYYFFVSPARKDLAERIQKGLQIAQADGSYDELFFEQKKFANAWKEINSGRYDIIELTSD